MSNLFQLVISRCIENFKESFETICLPNHFQYHYTNEMNQTNVLNEDLGDPIQ